jgi:hypothetical protein
MLGKPYKAFDSANLFAGISKHVPESKRAEYLKKSLRLHLDCVILLKLAERGLKKQNQNRNHLCTYADCS